MQQPATIISSPTTTTTSNDEVTVVLRRRPEMIRRNQHIRDGTLHVDWEEGTIDNENMGKKKSKKCCIFRKPKPFDQSSDESDWEDPDQPSDPDNGNDDGDNKGDKNGNGS